MLVCPTDKIGRLTQSVLPGTTVINVNAAYAQYLANAGVGGGVWTYVRLRADIDSAETMKVTDVSGSALVVERGATPLAFIAATEVQFYMGPEAVADLIAELAPTSSLSITSSDSSVNVTDGGDNQFDLTLPPHYTYSSDGSLTITSDSEGGTNITTTKSAIGCCGSAIQPPPSPPAGG